VATPHEEVDAWRRVGTVLLSKALGTPGAHQPIIQIVAKRSLMARAVRTVKSIRFEPYE
jgi:hypothetical protein